MGEIHTCSLLDSLQRRSIPPLAALPFYVICDTLKLPGFFVLSGRGLPESGANRFSRVFEGAEVPVPER